MCSPRGSHHTSEEPSGAASRSCAFPFYSLVGAPTLSRLLEAGPAQFTSPLASFSAVASEPPAKLLPPPVEPVSQATIVMMPTLSAPSVVPPAAAPESVVTGACLNGALIGGRTCLGHSTQQALSWRCTISNSPSFLKGWLWLGFGVNRW